MAGAPAKLSDKPGAWVDLALTLPIFVAYHLGVVFLKIKNATDYVTRPLLELADGNRGAYVGLTIALGVLFAGIFMAMGRGQAFRLSKFAQMAVEGVLYAIAMRLAAQYVVGRLPLLYGQAAQTSNNPIVQQLDPVSGTIMSLGAGLYEELAFRVLLFGVGAKILVWAFTQEEAGPLLRSQSGPWWPSSFRVLLLTLVWGVIAAAAFSAAHYLGALRDQPDIASFVFRFVLGLALTLIYVSRGFAAAVWTHVVYDLWVLVF